MEFAEVLLAAILEKGEIADVRRWRMTEWQKGNRIKASKLLIVEERMICRKKAWEAKAVNNLVDGMR